MPMPYIDGQLCRIQERKVCLVTHDRTRIFRKALAVL
jgi:hypothetical protein